MHIHVIFVVSLCVWPGAPNDIIFLWFVAEDLLLRCFCIVGGVLDPLFVLRGSYR